MISVLGVYVHVILTDSIGVYIHHIYVCVIDKLIIHSSIKGEVLCTLRQYATGFRQLLLSNSDINMCSMIDNRDLLCRWLSCS